MPLDSPPDGSTARLGLATEPGRGAEPGLATEPGAPAGGPPPTPPRASYLAVLAAAALVGGCALTGLWLTRHGVNLHLGTAYPVGGHYRLHLGGWLLVPLAMAAAAYRYGPRLAATLPWRGLLVLSVVTSAAWALGLAVVAGPRAIGAPLTSPHEYLHDVGWINSLGPGTFLRLFTGYLLDVPGRPHWTTHVAGHPPLASLVFAGLARVGLGGPYWAAAVCVGVGATAAASVLSTVRLLAGQRLARRATLFVPLAPAAIWIATSADAMFTGVTAAGVCALAHAAAGRGARAAGLALAGGLALGAGLMLSYGLVLIAPVAVAVVLVLRGPRAAALPVLLPAAAVALAVLGGFALAGFWWLDGLALTRIRMVTGPGWLDRPTVYFWFANPAALAMCLGPAVVAALPLLPRLRVWRPHAWRAAGAGRSALRLAAPALGALLAVALAIASNLSKGEVERIYLPFAVWLLPLAALLPDGTGRAAPARMALLAQLGWALLVASTTSLAW